MFQGIMFQAGLTVEESLKLRGTKLQRELDIFPATVLPPPHGGTVLEVRVDRFSVIIDQYLTVTLKVTNVGGENHAY